MDTELEKLRVELKAIDDRAKARRETADRNAASDNGERDDK